MDSFFRSLRSLSCVLITARKYNTGIINGGRWQ